MALTAYEDLVHPSPSNPAKTSAQLSADRMRDSTAPMPPAGLPAASEVAPFDQFIAAGYPVGTCGSVDAGPVDAGVDPFAAPAKCTSNSYWFLGNLRSTLMHPGVACVACHSQSLSRPQFAVAGTVYPSAHEPNDCNATLPSGVKVVVMSVAGSTLLTLSPNSVGNFSSTTAVATPFRVKVTYSGRERAMSATVTSGDCNSCHTQTGASNAPGRILLP